jgi:outer membrane receptor protein involved in Fe transport
MLRFGLLLSAATAAMPAAAQPPKPDEIVVTGRGLGPTVGEQVFDVVVLGPDRLAGSASNRLEEILRDVPGFQLFRRSDSRSANPTSQGATLRALGGNASSRALLLLDGVPQTDPFGGWISWPAFDPPRLGAVRVTRGGGSGAQGPGALAGTIELESALPADLAGPRASIAYGSRNSVDAHAGLGARFGSAFVSASGAYASGEGFIPVVRDDRGPVDRASPYEQASLSLRAVAPVARGTELQASALLFRDDRERGTAFSDIRTDGADASLRLVGPRWSALAYVQARDFANSFASVNAARTAVTRASEQFDVPSTGLGGRLEVRPRVAAVELRLGADARRTDGVSRERFAFQNGAGTRQRAAGGETLTLGAFGEASWRSGAVTLTAGGRLDRWGISNGFLKERVIATGATLIDAAFEDRSGWEPTGRAGFAWRAGGGITVRGAGYLGWRLPTLNELYRPFRVGADATAANAALEPERLRGIEAGLDWRPTQRLRVGATAFHNRLTGAIANVTLGRGPGLFPGVGFVAAGGQFRQRRNLDAVDARGIEADARLALGRWSLTGGYSFVVAKVEASGPAAPLNGLRPAQTPRHSFASTLAWAKEGARASLSARYASAQFEDDLNGQSLAGALTLDAAGVLPLTRGIALEARAENVTDTRVIAGISGQDVRERATPRTLWICLRFGG